MCSVCDPAWLGLGSIKVLLLLLGGLSFGVLVLGTGNISHSLPRSLPNPAEAPVEASPRPPSTDVMC